MQGAVSGRLGIRQDFLPPPGVWNFKAEKHIKKGQSHYQLKLKFSMKATCHRLHYFTPLEALLVTAHTHRRSLADVVRLAVFALQIVSCYGPDGPICGMTYLKRVAIIDAEGLRALALSSIFLEMSATVLVIASACTANGRLTPCISPSLPCPYHSKSCTPS